MFTTNPIIKETDMTFAEVCEEIKLLDEITVMELLEISSEDLVDRFEDKVELKYETLAIDFTEDKE